jgi:uncharacterized membrane protein YfcA
MALSDHEQQLLEQMERALASEDPKFASALRGSMTNRAATKSIGVAVLGVVIGVGILLAAVTAEIPALGVLGFMAIVAGFYFAQKGAKASQNSEKPSVSPGQSTAGGFMQGLEDRWDRRQDNGQ